MGTNRLHTVLLAAVAALLALGALTACSSQDVHLGSYYDPEGFYLDNGRWYYESGDAAAAKTGVDVSDHQEWIDWQAAAEDGVEFAMIRIGYRGVDEGLIQQDDYFEYNLEAAHEAGIECGVYFFSQAISEDEAREEAEFVLSALGGADLEYPVAYDFEPHPEGVVSRAQNVTGEELTSFAAAFCETVEQGGYDTMIYGNASDLRLYNLDVVGDRMFWLARYDSPPTSINRFEIWQYSNNGTVDGIDAAVDLNLDLSAAQG